MHRETLKHYEAGRHEISVEQIRFCDHDTNPNPHPGTLSLTLVLSLAQTPCPHLNPGRKASADIMATELFSDSGRGAGADQGKTAQLANCGNMRLRTFK